MTGCASMCDRWNQTLAALLLLICVDWVSAAELGPPDTSSPRATFASILELSSALSEHYHAYLATPNARTQQTFRLSMDRFQHLMDLSAIAPAARREVAAETITRIFELLARVELPGGDEIPDAAAFASGGPLADQPPKWRVPGTAVVIERLEGGTSAGEFLISAKTVASAREYAEAARGLPYLRPLSVGDLSETALRFSGWMLPPHRMAKLPDWAQEPIAGQVVWKWFLLLVSLTLYLTLVAVIWRWATRSDWDGRITTLLRRLATPIAMLALMRLLRIFLDEQVHVSGTAVALPDYLAEVATGLALVWIVLLLAGWNPVGTVEAIGLRSTKIRQFDRSLITIPNADLVERNIVNMSACETFLLQQMFALRYETTDDQLILAPVPNALPTIPF